MKYLTLACFGLFCFSLCGATGCEEKLAEKYGIKIQEDPPGSGKYKVIEDPAHGQIGQTVEIAQNATSGIPIAGQVVGGLSLLSTLAYSILKARAYAKVEELNSQHDDTHNATALALQNFVNSQPHDIGKALVAHLDAVHDHMDVPADHQDLIQPALKAA